MKKIITAIDNPKIYNEIKKIKEIKIIAKDLIYKEAILEILEKNKNIDIIIIYEKILGEINFFELIKKIKNINKKIKLIIILENKNEKLENKLKKINIKNIYLKNKINSKKIIEIINEKNKNKKTEKNNKKIKKNNKGKIINIKKDYFQNLKKLKNRFFQIKKEIQKSIKKFFDSNFSKVNKIKLKKTSKHNNKNKNETILILGYKKSGKTLISLLLAQKLEKTNKKISIINLSDNTKERKKCDKLYYIQKEIKNTLRNKKIENIKKRKIKLDKNKLIKKYRLKINKKNKYIKNKYIKNKKLQKNKNENIKKLKKIKNILLMEISKNINYYSNFNYIKNLEKEKKNKYTKKTIDIILKIIKMIKKETGYTIIELSSSEKTKLSNKIIKNADKVIIIIEANFLGIKRSEEILKRLEKEKELSKKSLHIVFNKLEKNKISNKILKEIFKNYKIIKNIIYNKKLKNISPDIILKNKNKINLKI